MRRIICLMICAFGALLSGCGPDTIFLRPSLDTTEQHLAAGRNLLERGKYDDAIREFMRAKVLMASPYVSVHIGLGLALAHKGAFAEGQAMFDKARETAVSDADKAEVKEGYEKFKALSRQKTGCRSDESAQ